MVDQGSELLECLSDKVWFSVLTSNFEWDNDFEFNTEFAHYALHPLPKSDINGVISANKGRSDHAVSHESKFAVLDQDRP